MDCKGSSADQWSTQDGILPRWAMKPLHRPSGPPSLASGKLLCDVLLCRRPPIGPPCPPPPKTPASCPHCCYLWGVTISSREVLSCCFKQKNSGSFRQLKQQLQKQRRMAWGRGLEGEPIAIALGHLAYNQCGPIRELEQGQHEGGKKGKVRLDVRVGDKFYHLAPF